MPLFIPGLWVNAKKEKHLQKYATKLELLNFLKKEANGGVDLKNKNISNLAAPVDDLDAINKSYFIQHTPKPIIAIIGESQGRLTQHLPQFSFGANAFKELTSAGGAWQGGKNGVAMPTSGRVLYVTVSSTTPFGRIPYQRTAEEGPVEIAILINNVSSVQSVKLADGMKTGRQLFSPPLQFNAGDSINFVSKSHNLSTLTTIAAAFVQLEI